MLKQRLFVVIACLFLMVPTVAVSAERVDLKKGKLEHLVDLIGTYDYETFMADPVVAGFIGNMLDQAAKRHFLNNMQTQGPVEFVEGYFWLGGGRAHETNTENAILMINSDTSDVLIGVRSNDLLKIYRRGALEGDARKLPEEFKYWIYQDEIKDALLIPQKENEAAWNARQNNEAAWDPLKYKVEWK